MTAQFKLLVQCPKCKGFRINQDASYRVNEDEYSVYDDMVCEGCDYNGSQFIEHKVPMEFDFETDKLP